MAELLTLLGSAELTGGVKGERAATSGFEVVSWLGLVGSVGSAVDVESP